MCREGQYERTEGNESGKRKKKERKRRTSSFATPSKNEAHSSTGAISTAPFVFEGLTRKKAFVGVVPDNRACIELICSHTNRSVDHVLRRGPQTHLRIIKPLPSTHPLPLDLPRRFRSERREGKPVVIFIFLEIGKGDDEEVGEEGGGAGGEDGVPDLWFVLYVSMQEEGGIGEVARHRLPG